MRQTFTRGWPVLVLFLALWVLAGPALLAPPAPMVNVSQPHERQVQEQGDFTGRLEAVSTVDLRARVTGYLDRVLFQEGSKVKRGDVLFQIDDRPYKLEVERAEAEQARCAAQRKLAEANYQRGAELAKSAGIGKDELDKRAAQREETEAALKAAQAVVALARLNLDFTRVTAPIDGRIGRAFVDAGNLVTGDKGTVLATIVRSDLLYVYFDLDERSIARLRKSLKGGEVKEAKRPVHISLAGEEEVGRVGVVDFIDNRVDPASGTLRVRAVLTNPDDALRPGTFARVRLPLAEAHAALLVADAALASQEGKEYVLVVNDKNEIERRFVRTGPLHGNLREIVAGLKKDDWVVVAGAARVKPGDKVEPVRVAMPEKLAPRAAEPPAGRGAAPPLFPGAGPALAIATTYPGANARVLQEAVAAPIEQQLTGLEGLVHTFTSCANGGELLMTLVFQKGTDLNLAQVQVQNRVSLAMPVLPDEVKDRGLSVKKRGSLLLGVALTSPDGSRDPALLSQLAGDLRDELGRVASVAAVEFLTPEASVADVDVVIDQQKLVMLGLAASDVLNVLRDQKQLNPRTGRRPQDAEALGRLIIKADNGRVIQLRDVAKIESVRGWPLLCSLDGKPCAFLQVYQLPGADPAETTKAVQARLNELAKRFPAGVKWRTFLCEGGAR